MNKYIIKMIIKGIWLIVCIITLAYMIINNKLIPSVLWGIGTYITLQSILRGENNE